MNYRIAGAVSCALSFTLFFSQPVFAGDGSPSNNSAVRDIAKHKSGDAVYIVELEESPVATYTGNIEGYHSTSASGSQRKLNTRSNAVKQYRQYLKNRQQRVLSYLNEDGTSPTPLAEYQLAFNGFAVKMTAKQAKTLENTQGVKKVHRDNIRKLDAYVGPETIGAPSMWNGSETVTGSDVLGEGMVVAILDTGINSDHPSFADVGDDGYNHTNPLGSGNYLGDCAGDFPSLCNDKLIGVYSYSTIVSAYNDSDVFTTPIPSNGEDYNGHGSHVAATAAGNILYNVAEVIPEYDVAASSGIETGYIFEELSGVAPHANIISYQVCYPGEDEDTYTGCLDSVILQALEDIIDSGVVDSVNMSISGGDFPWESAVNAAWLNAHSAGIFLAHSAGNDGPSATTTDKHAPWLTAVAATTHGITVSYEKSLTDFSGGATSLATLTGFSNTGAITAPIVYAGDFTNPNDPQGDAGQCLEPFPANTFSGQIVVCDRGDIARIQKARNVQSGGAEGFVLANVQGGDSFLANDAYVIPGIHIDADDGDRLKTWLDSGSGHVATITASTAEVIVDEQTADKVANFSSRGPNTSISTLTPMISAPGAEIYAAWADEHYGHEESGNAPADFAYSSGTSMASPHVAGAALLLKQDHPTWTPDNIRSAMMLTAKTDIQIENQQTAADWFDMGAGRLQIDVATQTGLIMNETRANYLAANPQEGGEPRSLNTPAIVDESCLVSCSWSRTFTATRSASWNVSTLALTNGLSIAVSPTSFSLNAGESQTITVTIDTLNSTNNEWAFGSVQLSSNDSPNLHLPVAAYASNGSIPQFVAFDAMRDADSRLLKDITAAEIESFNYESYGLTPLTSDMLTINQDPTPEDLFDTNEGIVAVDVEVGENALRLYAETLNATANDLDLYLAYDADGNGSPSEDEIRAESISTESDEVVDILRPEAGTWFIVIQGWNAATTSEDGFQLDYVVVDEDDEGNLTVSGPQSNPALTAFDLRVLWDLDTSEPGTRYFGAFALGSTASEPDDIGITYVEITRGEDDVYLSVPDDGIVALGSEQTINVNIANNTTGEDRDYRVAVTLPDTVTLIEGSISDGGMLTGDQIIWEVTQPDSESLGAQTQAASTLNFTVRVEDNATPASLVFNTTSSVTNIPGTQSESTAPYTGVRIEGAANQAPTLSITSPSSVVVGGTITIRATATDPEGDSLSFTINGTDGAVFSETAQSASAGSTVVYTVTVSDGTNTVTDTVSVSVTAQSSGGSSGGNGGSSGGGSFGMMTLLLVPLIAWRKVARRGRFK
ncbi:S8 family serine peptidase [Alteromonas confluentis]|uniref:Peptidase S8 n=1 Tax=Alteromonas confluentis TaxID=1656094 RepID=A0A1E7ZD53_9ALTE|nr:S8 family serine peptidase [Alteromonas confluentis]OFC71446.1 hypothetical protein BFC18_08200 [Alteromonas confluentis]